MTLKPLAVATLLCTLPFASAAFAASVGGAVERAGLSAELVERWGADIERTYKIDRATWAAEMAPVFASASSAELRQAIDAIDFDLANSVLLGNSAAGGPAVEAAAPKALGDAASDLVYVPITPCRIFDTRLSGGAIAANTVRGIDVTAVSDYSFQGGAANDCGIGQIGSFAAVAINLTTVSPAGAGYVTAFPVNTTQPTAATLNYTAGEIVNSLAIVKLDQGASANEMNVYTFASTHLVGDVVGYFTTAVVPAKPLQCTEAVGTPVTFSPGAAINVFAPACPAGYLRTTVQCRPSSYSMRLVGVWSSYCNFINEGTGTVTAEAASTCCRVTP